MRFEFRFVAEVVGAVAAFLRNRHSSSVSGIQANHHLCQWGTLKHISLGWYVYLEVISINCCLLDLPMNSSLTYIFSIGDILNPLHVLSYEGPGPFILNLAFSSLKMTAFRFTQISI